MADQPEKLTVIAVEDHPTVVDGLKSIFMTAGDIELVGSTGDGRQALAMIEELVPDVAVVDIVLKNSQINGIEVTQGVRDVSPCTQVLILSGFEDDPFVFGALSAGAMGYLLKTASSHDLLEAVRSVAHRHPVLHPIIFEKITAFLQSGTAISGKPEIMPALTRREMEVVSLVAEGCSNREIAARLVISEKTAKTHVSNIMEKMHFSSRLQVRYWALKERAEDRHAQPDELDPPQISSTTSS